MKIALAQLNPTVGAIDANCELARKAVTECASADVLVFPELFICGYPPEDLVLKPAFVDACMAAIENLAGSVTTDGPAVLVGCPWRENGKVYNAVILLDDGKVHGQRYKVELPNYSVFDEKRVFEPGPMPGPINVRGVRIGVPICEDIWIEDVCECLEETGSELLIVPNGSPFARGKVESRQNMAVARVTETNLPLVYVNQVGGQDELVFDGASFVLNADAALAVQCPAWKSDVVVTEWEKAGERWVCQTGERATNAEGEAADYQACVLGLRDYVEKNGFKSVVLGLSGGVDSALCAAIAVDALGADRVHCVMLPYRFTSNESLSDAADCAEALGVRYDKISISTAVEGFETALAPLFSGTEADITEENLQSRTRGTILMALSNKFGGMVVTTGNKSEVSVGYATLYGDMNGGFNPIKDLYKTEVFSLCRYRNTHNPENCLGPSGIVIPENIITKPPTAELRENQTDQDSLPDYDKLDDILISLVERELSVAAIIDRGHDTETVHRIQHLLYIAEYKRRQSAPGVKISERNFGRDRRYPITNRFRDSA